MQRADAARRVRVLRAFEARRLRQDRRAAPGQIIVYPAGWRGLMPAHHIAAAGDAVVEES